LGKLAVRHEPYFELLWVAIDKLTSLGVIINSK